MARAWLGVEAWTTTADAASIRMRATRDADKDEKRRGRNPSPASFGYPLTGLHPTGCAGVLADVDPERGP